MEFKYSNSMIGSRNYFSGLEKKIEELELSADWHYQSFCFKNDADGLVLVARDLDIVIWAYSPYFSEVSDENKIRLFVGSIEDLDSNNLPKQRFNDEVIFKLDSNAAINYVIKKIERKKELMLGTREVMCSDVINHYLKQTIITYAIEKSKKGVDAYDEFSNDITLIEIADRIAPYDDESYLEFLIEYLSNKNNWNEVIDLLHDDMRIYEVIGDKYHATGELYFEIHLDNEYLIDDVEKVVVNEMLKYFDKAKTEDITTITNNVKRYISKQISKIINEQNQEHNRSKIKV